MLSGITVEAPFLSAQAQDSADIIKYQQIRRQRLSEKIEPIYPIPVQEIIYHKEERNELVLPERLNIRQSSDWETGIFVISLLLLVFVRLYHSSYLKWLSKAAVNFNTAARMFREKSLSRIQASVQMEGLFYVIFSFFIYKLLDNIQIHIYHIPIVEYLIICGGVVCFFLAKKALYILQGNICNSYPETKEYLFNMNIFNQLLAVLLFPISIVISLSRLNSLRWAILIGILLIFICYLCIISRGIKILIQKRFSIFYLILYLCTLEILPFLYVYKIVTG